MYKKREVGRSLESPRGVTWQRVDSILNVHVCPLEGGVGQSWVKFGPRSCWTTPNRQHCFCTWLPSVSNPCYHINLHLEDMIPIHRLYLPILQRFNTKRKLDFTIFYLNIQTTSRTQIQFMTNKMKNKCLKHDSTIFRKKEKK